MVHVGGDELPTACYAEATLEVRISAPGGAMAIVGSDPHIFLSALDARFTSTEQARVFAANLLAACDRLDGDGPPPVALDGPVTISVVPGLGEPFAWWDEDRHLAIQQGTPTETAAALRAAADRLDGVA
ncbi:hypothetical protein ASG41_13490 [Modestobacter sp. Leaf380]|nr:hypothetical protein ASG41_13490 [Modestobacter sp. Leaf380]